MAAIGVGAVAMVAGVIVLNTRFGGNDGGVDIPERTVATQGRTLGPEDARITVEEYSDFQCPACALAAETLVSRIEEQYVADGRAKLVFRPMAILGQESLWAAEAAECANEQGRFWDYHDQLFENQQGRDRGAFAIDRLKGFAEELGLDTEAFNQCIDSHTYAAALRAETEQALNQGIESTPTFIVEDETVTGAVPFEDLQKVIEAELRKNP
jgi:protein-disulfide isomerase